MIALPAIPRNPSRIMKKTSATSILVSAIVLAGLCGCGSNSGGSSSPTAAQTGQAAQAGKPEKPKKDKRPIEQRLAVGMTMDEVKAACGNPKNVSMNSDGSAVWMYNNSQNAWIPYYMETGHKIHYVTVFFDANGKVKSWSSNSTGMY
jgi:outer membrane protein assembly factor BamE (lipoprotein component of BamABCDE complex)